MNATMDALDDIIGIQRNIRNKYEEMKRGKLFAEDTLEETLKPITEPLKELTETKKTDPFNTSSKDVDYHAMFLEMLKTAKSKLDFRYGLHSPGIINQEFCIGDTVVQLFKNVLIVRDNKFHLTEGLFELLVLKCPKKFQADDLEAYKQILNLTNVHRKNHSSNGLLMKNKFVFVSKLISCFFRRNCRKSNFQVSKHHQETVSRFRNFQNTSKE